VKFVKNLFPVLFFWSFAVFAVEVTYKGQSGPVTFGVPFKQGAVKDASVLNLNGKPLQVKVNASWSDGSVKWALFDTDLPAGFKGKFTVGKKHQGKLLFQNGVLSNGHLQVTFPKQGPLFCYEGYGEKGSAELLVKLQHDSPGECEGENWLKSAGAARNFSSFTSAAPRQISVEENGPQRATVRIAGEAGYKYILRLTLYKNEDTLKIQTTFICSRHPDKNFLRSMVLRINRPGKTVQKELVTGTPRVHHLVSWRKKSSPSGKGVLHDGKLTAAVKDFARLFPKELSCDKKGISFHIWPENSGKVLDLRRRKGVDRRYLEYPNPEGGFGVAKTHELHLSWSNPHIADRINKIEIPAVSPEYMRSTLACGEYLLPGKGFPKSSAMLDFSFKYLHNYKRAGHFDGMMDWGDIPLGTHGMGDHMGQKNPEGTPFRGYTGWSNGDLATGIGFFVHYLRTGDQRTLRDGLDMAWHLADVDTVHDWPMDKGGTSKVGLGRRHDQQHWGTFPLNYGYLSDEGVYAYLLTGEGRFLEVLEEVASNPGTYFARYMAVRLYEITGKKKYLDKVLKALQQEPSIPRSDNFRGNSYDAHGYLYMEQILPGVLKKAVLEGAKKYAPRYRIAWLPKGYPPYMPAVLAYKYAPTAENLHTLKVLLMLIKGFIEKDYSIASGASMAEYDKKWTCTNLPVASLMYWASLPYALETLRKAGVTEEECFKMKFKWQDMDSFVIDIDSSKVKKSAYPQWKHYIYSLKTPIFPGWGAHRYLDKEDMVHYNMAVRRLKLYENGRLAGPVGYLHRLIQNNGVLGWVSFGNYIEFTTFDNSHPASNGRKSKLVYTSEKDWKWQDKPSFKETLTRIYPYPDINKAGKEWCAILDNESPETVMVPNPRPEDKVEAAAALKRHRFTENGKVITNWRRCQNLIIFRTPDNSDPRTNGRVYQLIYKNKKDK